MVVETCLCVRRGGSSLGQRLEGRRESRSSKVRFKGCCLTDNSQIYGNDGLVARSARCMPSGVSDSSSFAYERLPFLERDVHICENL